MAPVTIVDVERFPSEIFVHCEGPYASVCLLEPSDDVALAWLQEHTDPEAVWLGRCLPVEARYVWDVVSGAQADGIEVRGGC